MKKSLSATVWLAVLLVVSGNSIASSAWWMLCDWCQTDSDFQHQALNAPSTYSPVYVTNRQTNETRKYNRTFIVDDLWDGIEQTVAVTTANFPASVKAVFEQAVNDANIIFVRLPREDLVGNFSNLGGQDSVVGDISNGSIDNEVINAVIQEIERLNLLPTHISVNNEAGLGLQSKIGGVSGNLGSGSTIRIRDLNIEITYSDGSTISFRRRGSDGKLVNWSVKDAEGNSLPITGPDESGNVNLNLGSLLDRDIFFGGSGSQLAVLALMDLIHRETGVVCSSGVASRNGVEVIVVRCSRR